MKTFAIFNKNVLAGLVLAISFLLILAYVIFGPISERLSSSRQALCRQRLLSLIGWINDYKINKGNYPKTIEMLDEAPELHDRVLESDIYCPVTKKKYIYTVTEISGKEYAILGDCLPHFHEYNCVYQAEGSLRAFITLPLEFYKSHEEFVSVINSYRTFLREHAGIVQGVQSNNSINDK